VSAVAFHVERARQLAATLQEMVDLTVLLPPRKARTLVTSLRVIRMELDQALGALEVRARPPRVTAMRAAP
jgi:hypothetical protein